MIEALISIFGLFLLVFLRIPLAFALMVTGVAGVAWLVNSKAAFALLGQTIFDAGMNYDLSVVPLFILMGGFVTHSGLSRDIYSAANALVGHKRGGLAMATVIASGFFSAVCGSSLATAATMSKVAMPPMRRLGYADSLAAASIAAGGTLGILIPPSVILVIFGLLTETSINKLFMAGVLPGLIGVLFYLGAVRYTVWRNPAAGPVGGRTGWGDRLRALRSVWPTLLLFLLVMGGIYAGWFTPTEAAGVGAFGAFLIALARRRLSWKILYDTLFEATRTTAMLFIVLIGALIFSNFVNRAGLPQALIDLVTGFDMPALGVIFLIVLVYLVLGCVFESLSMLLLTVPIFFPLVKELGVHGITDPHQVMIWFGIVVVVVTEISLITPPIGLNVFVLRGVLADVSTRTIFRGVTPFWVVDILRLLVLILIPALSLFLPDLMPNTAIAR